MATGSCQRTDLLYVDAVASAAEYQTGFHGLCEALGLQADLFLLFAWKVDKVVVFGTDEEWDGGLVEATALAVPLLDRVECALAGEIEHEENSDGVVTD